MKRRVVSFLLVVSLVCLFTACGASAHSEPWVMKLCHDQTENHQFHKNALRLGEIISERTNGAIKVEVYTNGLLGDINTILESLIAGNIEMAITGGSIYGNFEPAYQLVEVPYFFKSYEQMNAVLYSDNPAILAAEERLYNAGMKRLAWIDRPNRHVMSGKPVNTLEDIAGLKIRVPATDCHVLTWKAMGANPTPITWSEVFATAQQGVIDAVENPMGTLLDNSFPEIWKNLAMTGHCISNGGLMIGKPSWEKLTPEQQKIFMEAAAEIKVWNDEVVASEENMYLQRMKDQGVAITYPDTTEWVKAAQTSYAAVAERFGQDFFDAFQNYGK